MKEQESRMKIDLKGLLFRKRLVVLIGVLLTITAAPVGILTFNQYRDAEATVSDALRRDAQSYATDYGVGLDEAIRRLQLQETIGDFDSELQSNEAGTFGGLWIEHGPAQSDFKVVALFTNNGEQTIRGYDKYVGAGGPLSSVVEARQADATLATLRARGRQAHERLAALGIDVESGINVQENRVEIYVVERGRLNTAIANNNITLPSRTEVVTVGSLSRPAADIYGGLHGTRCTFGFSVEDEDNEKGITTAGHCSDNQSYNGTSLTFEEGHYNGRLDLQWHTTSFNETALVYDGVKNRLIKNTRGRHSVGQYVCKYGKSSEYSCGKVKQVNYTPVDITTGCHPGSCDWDDTWVRVRSIGNDDMCTQEDSGGPFFDGNTAVGTMAFCLARSANDNPSGQNDDDDAIYMKVNYFDDMDLTVLTYND